MFGWLVGAYNRVAGAIDNTVRSWVHNIVSGLYSFLHTIFGLVGDGWSEFMGAVHALHIGIDDLGHWAYIVFRHILKYWIPNFVRWVTRNILDPLLAAWRWLRHEGSILWHYITHPAILVEYLYDYILVRIEQTAWSTGKKLGRFFMSLIVHHVHDFLALIEDIIHAAL